MKRLILIIVFMLSALGAGWAQSCTPSALATCTPNLDLWLPSANYPNWNVPLNANFSLIDQAFGASHNGFPIVLGSTNIAGGSTNTSLNGLTINGVTLTASGSSSLCLTQAGTYATCGGGGSSGFPIVLGSTSIASGSTTTAHRRDGMPFSGEESKCHSD